ncbi:MAG: hypothetical protein GOU97_04195 [Nanoarchaeota archaeon]|nr:hypothetical protein [Nanoarchaeota archaeon]
MKKEGLGLKPKRKRGPGPDSDLIREQILGIISENWPIHASGILEHLHLDKKEKHSLILAKYHLDQLAREDKIKLKKIGQSMVAWPHEVEKLRIVHDLMRGL